MNELTVTNAPPAPLLVCENVTKSYSAGAHVLNNLNMTVASGRIVGLLGPNGSGKSTLIKLVCGLLTPDAGTIKIGGMAPGVETKAIVSYLPEKSYLNEWMKIEDIIDFFADFYLDFDRVKAGEMLTRLNIDAHQRLKTLSKGTKEKVQLVLVMSRSAKLYVLDEPIGGVDPAARDYILSTILTNYSENSAILISTHLIYDIEKALDDVLFIAGGGIVLSGSVDGIREERGKSIDELFREVFRC